MLRSFSLLSRNLKKVASRTLALLGALFFLHAGLGQAGEAIQIQKDIPYLSGEESNDASVQEKCKFDLYLPEKPASGFPLLVWFHGGGLTRGCRNPCPTAEIFAKRGIAVASADYRLNPQVKYPVYLQDAAMAVACAIREAVKKGANPKAIFVSGHSAGAYLTMMLAMDPHYLRDAGLPDAGFIAVSAQMVTHFTVRAERGIPEEKIIVDEAAPLFHARKDAPPLLLLVGGQDLPPRLPENQLFATVMTTLAKNETTTLLVVPDRTHMSLAEKLLTEGDIGGPAMLEFIKKRTPSPGAATGK